VQLFPNGHILDLRAIDLSAHDQMRLVANRQKPVAIPNIRSWEDPKTHMALDEAAS
jgi:hypothetical protein